MIKCLISSCKSSVILPSVISHLLQLLRGECCHLGTGLFQSLELYCTQNWVTIKETELSIQLIYTICFTNSL